MKYSTRIFFFRVFLVVLFAAVSRSALAGNASVTYTLLRAENVSINIYDGGGQIVRELLHSVPRSAGAHSESWDRRSNSGAMVAPGNYTWKVLGTTGLTATFITAVGSNYPVASGETNWHNSGGPGDYATPGAVAVDPTGMYVLADNTEGGVECFLTKLSLDGRSRLWSVQIPDGTAIGGRAAASSGTTLYIMLRNYNSYLVTIYKYDTTTGTLLGNFPITWNPAYGNTDLYQYDMDASSSTLVVSYQQFDSILWFNPATGALADSLTVPSLSPAGLTVATNGDVYVLTNSSNIQKISNGDHHNPTQIYSGLTSPNRIDVDDSNNTLLVSDLGTSQQIKRFSSTGGLLNTYGTSGGRVVEGPYTTAKRRDFRDVCDVTADGSGGFYVAEQSPPHRVVHFDSANNIQNELDGPQKWAPSLTVDPGNYTNVWQDIAGTSGADKYLLRETIDYTNKTATIASIYHVSGLASGMIVGNLTWIPYEIKKHNGDTLIVSANPVFILKLDTANDTLIPLMAAGNDNLSLPAPFQGLNPNNGAWIWTDSDCPPGAGQVCDGRGDGIPQPSEIAFNSQFLSHSEKYGNGYVDDSLTFYMNYNADQFGPNRIVSYPVAQWNSIGAPVYSNFTVGTTFANLPSACTHMYSYPAFMYRDTASGDMYVGYNDAMNTWGVAYNGSFLLKFNSNGQTVWQAGRETGNYYAAPRPGTITAFRRNLGMVNGTIGLTDFYEGSIRANTYVWDKDGLWVGGLLDKPLTSATVPYVMYTGGAENLGGILYRNPATGKVYYYSHWSNYGRIFEISGWDNWEHYSGAVTVDAPDEDLVAHYRFDRNVLTDLSTYGNHGSSVGNAGYSSDTPEGFGSSVSLTGYPDAVAIGDAPSLRIANNITIAFWIKGDPNQQFQDIFGNPQYSGLIFVPNGGLALRIDTSAGANQLTSIAPVLDNTWHHIAVTLNQGILTIVQDGVNTTTKTYGHGNGFASTLGWKIGGNSAGGNSGFVGLLDDIRIYKRALTPLELKAVWKESTDRMVLHYRFEDPESDHQATDSSPYLSHSGLLGEKAYIDTTDTPHAQGAALRLSADSDVVVIPTRTATNPVRVTQPTLENIANDITMAFWIKAPPAQNWRTVFGYPDYWGLVFAASGLDNDASSLLLRIDTWLGGVKLTDNKLVHIGAVLDNTWHHVAVCVSSGAVNILLDGVTSSSDSYAHGDGFGDTHGWVIGGPQGFHGLFDDVRIYRRCLTTPEMQAVYNPVLNVAPSFTKGPNQVVSEDAGTQTVPVWATAISPGPPSEANQTVNFIVSNSNQSLFAIPPAVSPSGTLVYAPAANANGSATVTVKIHDDGGTLDGGLDTSPPQSFVITVNSVNDLPTCAITSPATGFTQAAPTTITISASASDIDGSISRVDFYNNGILLGTDSTSPFSFVWNNVEAGGVSGINLTAVATDNSGAPGSSAAVVGTVTDSGLKCFWKLDEGAGSTANDSSGTGNSGTLSGGPSWTTGKVGSGLVFNGSSSYVQKASAAALPSASANQTLAAWIFVSAAPATRKTAIAVTGSGSGFQMGYISGTTVGVWKKTGTTTLVSRTAPSTGVWHHLAYVKSGSTNFFYVDGASASSTTPSDGSASHSTINVGREPNANYWPGKVDEVRIYNRALNASEVAALATGRQ